MPTIAVIQGNELTLCLAGRLYSITAPQLEAKLNASLAGVNSLKLDFQKLEYLSSAGLRVLISTQKAMKENGRMVILHPNDVVLEVFDLTCFTSILSIEH